MNINLKDILKHWKNLNIKYSEDSFYKFTSILFTERDSVVVIYMILLVI